MIDVHIIVSHVDPWLDECLASLNGEPVNIYFVPRVEGDLAKARQNGFSKGSSKYVAWVDADDLVVSGTFSKCLEVLENNKDCSGVYTNDVLIDRHGKFICNGWAIDDKPFVEIGFPQKLMMGIHHVRVLRRDAVEKCFPLKTKMAPEQPLMAEIQNHGELIHIPVIGYKWRMHDNNTFKTYTKEQIDEAINYIDRLMPCKIGTNSKSSQTGG